MSSPESMPCHFPRGVLDFWFGEPARSLWFASDPTFDEEIRRRFGATLAAATEGAFDGWTSDRDGALALVIVLDQFTRNLRRGEASAFANDPYARRVADAAIHAQLDLEVALERRSFFYLPFQHSESLADQQRSLEQFSRWAGEHPDSQREQAEEAMRYAHRHFEIIRRFGRFPHRNALLARTSTAAELDFLRQPNSAF